MSDPVRYEFGGSDFPVVGSAELQRLIDAQQAKNAFDDGRLRQFASGATRDTAQDKLDFEGFLAPAVLRRFAEYMHVNRKQSDGSLRSSDNWQKGIPRPAYMSSMWRHFMQVWEEYRNPEKMDDEREEALCALLFNVMGMLFEVLKRRNP